MQYDTQMTPEIFFQDLPVRLIGLTASQINEVLVTLLYCLVLVGIPVLINIWTLEKEAFMEGKLWLSLHGRKFFLILLSLMVGAEFLSILNILPDLLSSVFFALFFGTMVFNIMRDGEKFFTWYSFASMYLLFSVIQASLIGLIVFITIFALGVFVFYKMRYKYEWLELSPNFYLTILRGVIIFATGMARWVFIPEMTPHAVMWLIAIPLGALQFVDVISRTIEE